jgi:hypothetical protein
MFENAKKHSPCIIFIDEIDAVGRHRGAGMGGGNDEREQTLNQLLVEMDGFEAQSGVIVIAATNRADVLDKALLRPGRFDRQVNVGLPDIRGREQILNVHMRKVPIGTDVKADVLARGTPGFSGADLANLVNEAALFAARRSKRLVDMQDFEDAKDKIYMGPERKSMVIREEERRNTAYHESGHAVVAKLLPKADPVHKVTIMPRGWALGLTWQLPEHDNIRATRTRCWKRFPSCSAAVSRKRSSSARCPPAPRTTSRAPPSWPVRWSPARHVRRAGRDGVRRHPERRFRAAPTRPSRKRPSRRSTRKSAASWTAIRAGAQAAGREPRQGRSHDQGAAGMGNHRRRPDQRHHGRPGAASAESRRVDPQAASGRWRQRRFA